MTAREFAKKNGIEIVGKLTKQTETVHEYSYKLGREIEVKLPYWADEAGTVFYNCYRRGGKTVRCEWGACTPDGGVI